MRLVHAGAVGLLVAVLAACGGSGGGATAAPADAGADPTEAAATTVVEPVASAEAGGGGGGGGGGGDWPTKPCELLAPADVEQAAGASGMVATPIPMDATSGLCGYRSADYGAEVVLSVWGGDQATGMFTTLTYLYEQHADGIERIDGLGADAIFSSADGTLVVSKNGTAVQIAVRIPDKDAGAIRDIATNLGQQVADRL